MKLFTLAAFFSFFFYGHSRGMWKFLGWGLNPRCSCDLCHNCSNAESFTSLRWARDGTHTSTVTQAAAVRILTDCTTAGTPPDTF